MVAAEKMNYPLTTTLALLRKHGSCIAGYNKLAMFLKGTPEKEYPGDRYIRWKHTEQEVTE